jgi:hypothetical protein
MYNHDDHVQLIHLYLLNNDDHVQRIHLYLLNCYRFLLLWNIFDIFQTNIIKEKVLI